MDKPVFFGKEDGPELVILPEGAQVIPLNPPIPEARIRQIVREELAVWEKQLVQRARFGVPLHMETK